MNFASGVEQTSFKRDKRMSRNLLDRKVGCRARGPFDRENGVLHMYRGEGVGREANLCWLCALY